MKRSNIKFTLDIRENNGGCQLNIKRGDTHRRLHILLSDGGFPYIVDPDCFPVLMAKTEDGRLLYTNCTVEQGIVICDLTSAYTATAGTVHCELRLYDAPMEEKGAETQLLTSATFVIHVHPTVYNNEEELTVAGTVEATALSQLVGMAHDAIAQAEVIAISLRAERDSGGFDGMSLSHHWDGTVLTVSSRFGTSSADLKGEKGDPGPVGPAGECIIDDSSAGSDPWSGRHTVEAFCPPFHETGLCVSFTPMVPSTVTVTSQSDATLTVCGKNLFDPAVKLNTGYIYVRTGKITHSEAYRYTDPIPAAHLVGKVLTLNKLPGGVNPSMGFYAEDGTYLGGNKGNAITVPEGTSYLRFTVDKAVAEEGFIQLEIGDTATDFVPYAAETYSLTAGTALQFPASRGLCNFFTDGTPLSVSGYRDLITEVESLKETIRQLRTT